MGTLGTSIRLGRIAGIELGLNWSWFVSAALITSSLAGQVFPATNPGLSRSTHLAMALVATVCFFATLVLHELGHALQARREGIRIEGITLWVFGGVAKLGGAIPSAAAEFRVAVAGPLVSLALGGGLVALSWGAPLPAAVDGVVAWLGFTNLILLVFNLVPALPLDGGRVLRSALWRRWRDFRRATLAAARVARFLSFALIVGGLVLLGLQGAYSGLWLAFVGLFLRQAAQAEARAARSTPPDVLVSSVRAQNGSGFPLVVDDRVVAHAAYHPASGAPAGPLPRVEPSASLLAAFQDVMRAREQRALVVEDGHVLGILEFVQPGPLGLLRLLSFRSQRL